jgi:hypothetical protein
MDGSTKRGRLRNSSSTDTVSRTRRRIRSSSGMTSAPGSGLWPADPDRLSKHAQTGFARGRRLSQVARALLERGPVWLVAGEGLTIEERQLTRYPAEQAAPVSAKSRVDLPPSGRRRQNRRAEGEARGGCRGCPGLPISGRRWTAATPTPSIALTIRTMPGGSPIPHRPRRSQGCWPWR